MTPVVLGRRLRPGNLDECPDSTAASGRACRGITVCTSLVPSCSGFQVKFLHALDVPHTVKTRLGLEYAHRVCAVFIKIVPYQGIFKYLKKKKNTALCFYFFNQFGKCILCNCPIQLLGSCCVYMLSSFSCV